MQTLLATVTSFSCTFMYVVMSWYAGNIDYVHVHAAFCCVQHGLWDHCVTHNTVCLLLCMQQF